MSYEHARATLGLAAIYISDRLNDREWELEGLKLELSAGILDVTLQKLKVPGEPRRGKATAYRGISVLELGLPFGKSLESHLDELYAELP